MKTAPGSVLTAFDFKLSSPREDTLSYLVCVCSSECTHVSKCPKVNASCLPCVIFTLCVETGVLTES